MEAMVSDSEAKLADAWGERAILEEAAPKPPVKETHASRTSPAGAVGRAVATLCVAEDFKVWVFSLYETLYDKAIEEE